LGAAQGKECQEADQTQDSVGGQAERHARSPDHDLDGGEGGRQKKEGKPRSEGGETFAFFHAGASSYSRRRWLVMGEKEKPLR
jgi:hypothetical protein